MFYATNKDNVHYLISNPNDNDKYLCTPDSLKRLRRLIKIDIVEEEEKREYKGVDAFNKVKIVDNDKVIYYSKDYFENKNSVIVA